MLYYNVSLFLNLFFQLSVQLAVLADVDAATVCGIIVVVIVVRSVVRLLLGRVTILAEDVVEETAEEVSLVEIEQIPIALYSRRRVAVRLARLIASSRINNRLGVVIHGDVLLIALRFAGLLVAGRRRPGVLALLAEGEATQKFVQLLNEIVSVEASPAFLLLHTVAEAIAVERLSTVAARYAIVLRLAGWLFVQHHIRFVAVRPLLPGRQRSSDILTG